MEAVSIIATAPLVHDGWSLAAFVVALVFMFLKSGKFGLDKDAGAGSSEQHPRKRRERL